MKGDFTRLTFQPKKHYTSVRMQQGRLQLDSDWNEQVDIQSHLYQTQVVDMIGDDSGTSDKTSFVLSVTPDDESGTNDLVISPGRFYVDGILCELECGTPFELTSTSNESSTTKVEASTLMVDGQRLEKNQWIAIDLVDKKGKFTEPIELIQITNVDANLRQLTLSQPVTVPCQARRLVTYKTQFDYPNPDKISDESYVAYLDVWQRHISAIEDLNIREKALSLPDTTTRTKTVWQLRLIAQSKLPPETPENSSKSEEERIRARWKEFVQKKKQRRANMNACAKRCPNSGDSSSTSTNGQQLENQLYRVEIHKGGKIGVATFKWARDNASVASAIQKIQDATITPKFDQEAWQLTKPGQWLEITNEANELKGLPGVMVPFQSASLRKISFDSSRASGAIPESPTIVRRWHTGNQSEIPTSENWIELEQGIKVQFDPKSDYETGDYWLIPTRTDDIEWPDNGANQPLPQPPQGIEHHYGLIGVVKVNNGRFEEKSLQILRTLFPPLMKCLGEDGGIIKGTLEIQNNFYVTGQKDKQIEGRIGVGLTKPLARFHLQNAKVPVADTLLVNGKTVTGEGVAELNFGDILSNRDVTLSRTVVAVDPTKKSVTLNADLTVTNANFTYQPAIARMDDGSGTTQFLITASGNTGIGTSQPMAKLDVQVTENDGSLTGFHVHKPGTDSLFYVGKDGKVGIGVNTPEEKLQVAGDVRITGNSTLKGALSVENTLNVTGNSTLKGALSVGNNLNVTGDSILDKDLSVGNNLKVTGTSTLEGALSVNNNLNVTGNSTLNGVLSVNNNLNVTGNSTLDKDLSVGNNLNVTGNSTLNGVLSVNNKLNVTGTSTLNGVLSINDNLNVTGTSTLNGVLSVNNNLNVTGNSTLEKDLSVQNNLNVTGNSTLEKDLSVQNNLKVTGTSTLEGALSVNNNLKVIGTSTLNGALSVGTTFSVDTINRAVTAARLNVTGTAQAAALEISGNSNLKGTLTLKTGATVEEFSVYGNLRNTDKAVPTAGAVIGYVASQLKQINLNFDAKADKPGSSKQDFTTQNLKVHGTLQFDERIQVNAFSDNLNNSSDDGTKDAVPTQKAVKAYVDNVVQAYAIKEDVDNAVQSLDNRLSNELSGKASKGGSKQENFESGQLNVYNNLTVIGNVGVGHEPQKNAKLSVDGTVEATLFRGRVEPPSSRTLKENITAISSQEVAEVLRKLNPVRYSYKEDESQSLYLGFIAEDVPDILTSTDKTAVKLVDLVAVLTKALKDNRELTKTLLNVVKKQQEDIAILTKKVNTLEEQRRE